MLEHFEKLLNASKMRGNCKKNWDWTVYHIRYVYKIHFKLIYTHFCRIHRCLAHVINLATQALLAVYSTSKHYDPADPTGHEPEVTDFWRDEVGLIRGITVKVSILSTLHLMFAY